MGWNDGVLMRFVTLDFWCGLLEILSCIGSSTVFVLAIWR